MKHKFLILIAFAFIQATNLFGQCNDFVTVDGKKLKCGGSNFFALVINYQVELTYGTSGNPSTHTYPNNYYPSRSHGYFPDNNFSPQFNNAQADSSLRKDFRAIKAKGFNALRIYGFGYSDTLTAVNWNSENPIKILYTDPLYTQLLLDAVGGVLRSAKSAGLKVIFGAGANRLGDNSSTYTAYQAGYIDFLKKFGQRFGNDPTLLAVDFLNEPAPTASAFWAKNAACSKVKEWNDALKLHSNILSTIGLYDAGTTFFWDPNILNVDFISFHPYPYTNLNGPTSITDGINRVKSDFWWYKNNVTLPWIVGETGMSAHQININNVDTAYDRGHSAGTIQDQATFLHETLNAARDYGGAGYSWWEYSDQDVHNYAGGGWSFWGLIYANEGKTSANPPIVWKPAAQEITNFDPNGTGTAVQPPNYYNYYNESLSVTTSVVGKIYDAATSYPMIDALVELRDSIPGVKGSKFYYTYTNAYGDYVVYRRPGSIILYVKVTATECDVYIEWNNFMPIPGTVYYLNKLPRHITSTLTYANSSVSGANVYSYASISADFNNYQVLGSDFKVTAGDYINLKQGFVATSNSNFNAHIGPYYHNCGSFSFRKNTDEEGVGHEDVMMASKEISIEEELEKGSLKTRIFPNPGAGIYYIEIEKESTHEITVSNMYGSIIKTYSFKGNQGIILLENESPGVYLFTIKDQDNQIQNFKVVKE